MSLWKSAFVTVGLVAVMGCVHPMTQDTAPRSQDPVIARLDHGIMELNENLAHLRRHIADLKNLPILDDPLIQQLRAFDLSAWQVHEQQWQLQLEHLTFISDRIHRAQAAPADRAQLREEWARRQQEYIAALQQLREARHELERQRFLIESQLVQRYFE